MFLKYNELKLSLIPLFKQGKHPVISEWQTFSERLPTADEATDWENEFEGFNVGLVLGEASNVIAIDIDVEDQGLHDLCPPSPLRKRGAKGETRFFKYNPLIALMHLPGLDILTNGSQTVLPPSIHPETKKPYVWLTSDTFENFDVNDLPEISQDEVAALYAYVSGERTIDDHSVELEGVFSTNENRCPHGSHNRLKTLASALVFQKKTVSEAVDDLLRYDKIHHTPITYFEDTSRPDCKSDKETNAYKFFLNIRTTINKRLKAQGKEQLYAAVPTIEVVDDIELPKIERTILTELPPLTGLLNTIKQDVLAKSPAPNEVFATATAVSLLGTLVSSTHRFIDNKSNILSMIMGSTSSGKDIARSYITNVLSSEKFRSCNLVGLTNYVSAPQLILDLPKQRFRIDIVDEFSGFIKDASLRNDSLKRDIMLKLTALHTIGFDYFGGIKAITRGENSGACFAPTISLLALIQPDTFAAVSTKDFLDTGFFNRFLFWFSDERSDSLNKDAILKTRNYDFIIGELTHAFPLIDPLGLTDNSKEATDFELGNIRPELKEIKCLNQTKDYIFEIMNQIYRKDHGDDFVSHAMYSRCNENIMKLSMINAVSSNRNEILKDDIDFGYHMVSALISNVGGIMKQAASNSFMEKFQEKIANYIRQRKVVRRNSLANAFRGDKRARDAAIADLLEQQRIKEGTDFSKATVYQWNDDHSELHV